MKTQLIRIAIGLLMMIEIVWFVSPSHKSAMKEAYRHHERIEALIQYSQNPSPATKSAVQKEFHLLCSHQGKRDTRVFVTLLAVDGILVLVFWNVGGRKKPVVKVEAQSEESRSHLNIEH